MRKNENEMDFTNKNDIEDIVNNVNYLTSDNNNIEKLIQIKKDLNEFKEINEYVNICGGCIVDKVKLIEAINDMDFKN